MTLVDLATVIPYPNNIAWTKTDGSIAIGNWVTVDAAGEYGAFVFVAREAMTIAYMGVRASSVTGAPTVDLRVETVDASGFPSGTLWATDTNKVLPTLVSNTWTQDSLTASASIVAGDKVALVAKYNSGTTATLSHSNKTSRTILPYHVLNTGTPTKGVSSAPHIGVGSGASSFYCVPGILACSAITVTAFNNTTAGTRRGLRFKVPFNCRCVGLAWPNAASAGDYTLALYNDAGTELTNTSTAFDGDMLVATINLGNMSAYFDTPATLTRDTWYRVSVQPDTATNQTIFVITMPSSAYVNSTGWAGGNAHYTTYTTAGGWIDTATDQVVCLDLLLDQIDDGTGSGGTVTTAYTFA